LNLNLKNRTGSGSEGAQTNLQESYSDALTLQEAEDLALSTLKQVRYIDAEAGVIGLYF
jgi:20S proteasome alpha/beta subunit